MRLEHVSFTYPNQQEPALADISLKIGNKEKIVLVGVNGSGKSTLCKLITGAYQPDEGRVLWAEADLRTINKISLYQKTAMAPQLFTQFHLTVRENVALADLRRMDEDISVREAAEKTGLASALEEIGLDSMLGREFGGSELSGGQWQRLLLSRAIFKRAEVLILDEPTSALDPDTEYDILNSFLKMAEEKTALIVSHRVGLCRMADRVIFLEQGRIAADGPHDALMRTSPSYRRFYEAQSKWYQSGIIR